MAKHKDGDIITKDLGLAEDTNMDSVIRTVIAQMFECDNNIAHLDVTLNGTDAPTPPKVTLKLQLVAINDSPIEVGE